MARYKANKICTIGNSYYWESEFEYRGHYYTVTYSCSYSAFEQKPAYIQHKEAQTIIDNIIDNPQTEIIKEGKTFDEQMNDVWKMLEC